jgi:hypothetical protein
MVCHTSTFENEYFQRGPARLFTILRDRNAYGGWPRGDLAYPNGAGRDTLGTNPLLLNNFQSAGPPRRHILTTDDRIRHAPNKGGSPWPRALNIARKIYLQLVSAYRKYENDKAFPRALIPTTRRTRAWRRMRASDRSRLARQKAHASVDRHGTHARAAKLGSVYRKHASDKAFPPISVSAT